jgi:hypothetical protein
VFWNNLLEPLFQLPAPSGHGIRIMGLFSSKRQVGAISQPALISSVSKYLLKCKVQKGLVHNIAWQLDVLPLKPYMGVVWVRFYRSTVVLARLILHVSLGRGFTGVEALSAD